MSEPARCAIYVTVLAATLLGAMLWSQVSPQAYEGMQRTLAREMLVQDTQEIWRIEHWLEGGIKVTCTAMPLDQDCPLCTGRSRVSIALYGVTNDLRSRCIISGKPPSTGKLDVEMVPNE